MAKTTFDRIMKDPGRKKRFNDGYKAFLLDELILALVGKDEKSVRKLAKEAGVSPRIIQDIKSGKQRDIKLSNFFGLIKAFGYQLTLIKGSHSLNLTKFRTA